jgi:hypothetical protein
MLNLRVAEETGSHVRFTAVLLAMMDAPEALRLGHLDDGSYEQKAKMIFSTEVYNLRRD